MAATTAAKPQGFVLRMRLLSPSGRPFAKKQFRVKWAGKTYPLNQSDIWETDTNGSLSVLLEARPVGVPPGGEDALQVLDSERVVWSVPLQVGEDPPPVAMPELDIDEAPPTPPGEGASQQEELEYQTKLVHFENLVLARLAKDEKLVVFQQSWDQLRDVVSALPGRITKGTSPGQLMVNWELFCYYFALVIRGYEVAWRLWNLGDLPLMEAPTIQLLALDQEFLIRALDRFSFRFGLPVRSRDGVTPAMVEQCLKTAIDVHDRRGRVDPRIQIL